VQRERNLRCTQEDKGLLVGGGGGGSGGDAL